MWLERHEGQPSLLEAVNQRLAERGLARIVDLKTNNQDLPRHVRHSGNILLRNDILFEGNEQGSCQSFCILLLFHCFDLLDEFRCAFCQRILGEFIELYPSSFAGV